MCLHCHVSKVAVFLTLAVFLLFFLITVGSKNEPKSDILGNLSSDIPSEINEALEMGEILPEKTTEEEKERLSRQDLAGDSSGAATRSTSIPPATFEVMQIELSAAKLSCITIVARVCVHCIIRAPASLLKRSTTLCSCLRPCSSFVIFALPSPVPTFSM